MPKYVFKCTNCARTTTEYCPAYVTDILCKACDYSMERQLPNLSSETEVREVVDPFTNRKWQQDQKELLQERHDQHYWEVDVPRLVQTHSKETCLEQGWLIYNDKGELVINKPPAKR